MRVRVGVEIEVTDSQHCSNDCPFIEIDVVPEMVPKYQANCVLFASKLEWNKRRKYNGYRRCNLCAVGVTQ